MLERKKLLAGFFVALLSLNLFGSSAEAATSAEQEEARMWGGFRDKVSCTVEPSVAEKIITTKETVIVKEVPVYPYPFLFIWDDWYHWHHHHHVWHRPSRPPRPHIGRPPVHRPSRPSIVRPAPRPSKPSIVRPAPSSGRPQISRPSDRPNRPTISRPSGKVGGNRPVIRQAPKPRPQVKSAPSRSRSDEMIFQNGGARGGGARHHGGGRPSGGRAPRRGR